MYWKKVITPPHPNRYLRSCASLERTLASVDRVPVSFVCGQCWRVIKDAFGNQYSALWWILFSIALRSRRKTEEAILEFWETRILRLSEDELEKRNTERSNKRAGVDLDECARMVSESELEELLDSVVSED